MKRLARVPSQLSESLNQRVHAYALAASAAGVGVLTLAQAEAKIIYTPTHVDCSINGCPIAFTNDGFWNFRVTIFFSDSTGGGGAGAFAGGRVSYSEVVGTGTDFPYYAAALRAGVRVGAQARFLHQYGLMNVTAFSGTHRSFRGQWANGGRGVKNRYLGLKFQVNGKIHYGWGRFNVNMSKYGLKPILTGYAYETIPNKPIIAGKTHGKDEATLGRLAQGASGLSNGGKP